MLLATTAAVACLMLTPSAEARSIPPDAGASASKPTTGQATVLAVAQAAPTEDDEEDDEEEDEEEDEEDEDEDEEEETRGRG